MGQCVSCYVSESSCDTNVGIEDVNYSVGADGLSKEGVDCLVIERKTVPNDDPRSCTVEMGSRGCPGREKIFGDGLFFNWRDNGRVAADGGATIMVLDKLAATQRPRN